MKRGTRNAERGKGHPLEPMLEAAKRLHARGCRGITNAPAAWRDLTFTEKLVWMNAAALVPRSAFRAPRS